MAKPPPGGEDDIRYEVVMMGAFIDLLAEKHQLRWNWAEDGSQPKLIYTALFEACLLHARNVFEFVKVSPTDDTRSASTFAPNWDYAAAQKRVAKRYKAICTQLAHIGRNRKQTQWYPLDVVREALAEFEAVLETATKGDVELLRRAASEAREAIRRVERREGPMITTTN